MGTDIDLRARLRDLADDAPRPGLSGEDLWRAGVRRQRLRRAAAVTGTAVAVAVVVGLTSMLRLPSGPAPAEGPAELGLPRVVEAPAPWSEATSTPGPLSAVSAAIQREPEGPMDSREQLQLFGVSAVDGISRFLDMPGPQVNIDPSAVAISPDGTRVAQVRWVDGDSATTIRGWDVLDTTTGELTRLRVPGMPRLVGMDVYEISFSGDGRHLLTSFSLTGSDDSRGGSLVAWDVETGERHVAEESGHYWLPGPGSGPAGVVWTRGRRVMTFYPEPGETILETLPRQVVEAAYAPDSRRLAYIAHEGDQRPARGRWQLLIAADSRSTPLDLDIEPGQVLGWRDTTHVVVSEYGPREARVVNVETGEWEAFAISQGDDALMTPRYATDLLARPVAEGVEQPDAEDPRFWMNTELQWIAVGMLLGGVLQVWLVVRRRRGRG
ncbi:MAG: hypothetical protein ACXWDL_00385 [Nocardioides sp.]